MEPMFLFGSAENMIIFMLNGQLQPGDKTVKYTLISYTAW